MRKKVVRRLRRGARALADRWRRLTRTEVLVLGDSHAAAFHDPGLQAACGRYYLDIVSVVGATVSGLPNPNSTTQTMQLFRDGLARSRAPLTVTLMGEVDTGFVIWYRAEKHGSSVDETLAVALENYQKLLLQIAESSQVICISTPLPTISDDNDWGEVANARSGIKATQAERTALTLRFNREMAAFCAAHGMGFLDLDPESLGEDGVVRPYLLHADAKDHHYAPEVYGALIARGLVPMLDDLRAGKRPVPAPVPAAGERREAS